jgi:class 3 adenylate cyclase/tetratricopeptide (TPR) repeat protein
MASPRGVAGGGGSRMQCARCQAHNRDGRRFCGECGAALALVCPTCSFANEGGERFCGGCGAPLGTTAQPAVLATPAPAPTPAPAAYTPQHLADRIISSRGALEGERKQVTVLFADLKGSMVLLADRDPEDARQILDPVLERMMEAVHRYEGTVNQVMGDGIMALFGAPLAHEDHAVRACYAALRMQETVKRYADEVWRVTGVRVQIRVGLNSGEVVVRSIGSDLRMDYTAVGQTTHLAARMEQSATPGAVLIAPNTLRLVEGYVHIKALGPISVKGLDAPIDVYEVVGAGASRTRLQAAAARGFTRFVGRDAEIEVLRQTLDRAGAGHGQIVALVGEPGVGKSRLVWEFGHSHRTQGWLVLQSGSVSYGKATSYLPVIDLLKSYCGIEDRDDARRIREKVTGKLLTLDPALQPTLSPLLALLDVPVDDSVWQVLDPPQRRQRMLDACKRLLLRESQEQPLLLVCEDLHWIDAETQALLDILVDSLPTARLLLLVNYRPEYEHGWHRKTYYRQLRLDPLPPESADELLTALLGAADELEPLKRVLTERTEGNPFFLEESVRTLVEGGVIVGGDGAYHLAKPFESTQVPATVQAVLAARIDRLAPDDKRLLQAAAVIGKDVPYLLLEAITELSGHGLRDGLGRLQGAEFLYETSHFPALEYTFKHALTHEVTYGSLLHDRRRVLHLQIMEAIEAIYPDRLVEQVEQLAHHAVRAEAWEQAVAYHRQAGAKADARSAHREAAGHFEQALAALRHLPETRDTRERAFDLHLQLRSALRPLEQLERLLEHLREAEMLAHALADDRRVGRVSAAMANYHWMQGDYQSALQSAQQALAVAGEDQVLEAQATFRLGHAHHALGDYPGAAARFRACVELSQSDLPREQLGLTGLLAVTSRSWLIMSLAELGETAEAVHQGAEALRLADASDSAFSLVLACLGVGRVYLSTGDLRRAVPALHRGLALSEAREIPIWSSSLASDLGYAYALCGEVSRALPLLEQAVEHSVSVPFVAYRALRMVRLAEGYLLARRGRDAERAAQEALALAVQHKERGSEAWVLRLFGEIAAHADPLQAESYYCQALALTEELGMRPLAAHCHLGLGTLYQKLGRDEQAQAELATAAEMYRRMEMTYWLTKAEAALASQPSRTNSDG